MTELFDLPILLWIQEHFDHEILNAIRSVITFFGNKGWFFGALAVLLIIIPRTRYMGIPALISFVITAGINSVILKNLIGRARPFDFSDLIMPAVDNLPDSYSFPSGHTATAFAVALVLIRADKRIGIPAVIFASLIAISRVTLRVHYPSDIIAGFLLAFAVSTIVWLIWSFTPYAQRHMYK